MITILIAKDEKNIKEVLEELLRREGYRVSDGKDGASLKDVVIKLENSLHNEKKGVLYKTILDEVEKPLIECVLEKSDGNQLKAAKILGINRNTMRAKIKKLAIDISRWKR